MVIVNFQGKTGNNIFQFIAAYFFSRKHNLLLYINHHGCFQNSHLESIILPYHTASYIPNQQSIIIDDNNFLYYYYSNVQNNMN